ncbi:MAG: phage integrase N-terminal SAM-like domain-containing protein [Acidobacteriota bacterium]|nr:phage integrase N-terminal SAM-like domain-containing protein [Acidobacteriota bacterium]
MRHTARVKHLSRKTENAHVNYIRRLIICHEKRHPKEMGAEETRAFLKLISMFVIRSHASAFGSTATRF